jgi:rare lipoprotein A
MKRQTILTLICSAMLASGGIANVPATGDEAVEYGKCGYYADSFHGRPTANGEKYDKNALTCSHKTLPFGTKIRVTRLDNKKSVVVRVNDRGPFIEGYIVDVSGEAAAELDLLKIGTTRVKVEVVETAQSAKYSDALLAADEEYADNVRKNASSGKARLVRAQDAGEPATYSQDETASTAKRKQSAKGAATTPSSNLYKVDIEPSVKRGYGIQISSLSDANNVLPIVNKLQSQWPGKVLVNVVKNEYDEATYKVFVGPFGERKAAEAQQKTASKKGYKKTMIVDLEEL